MVTSIASRCCRILFLIGWAPLAHWKAEDLAPYYSHSYMCLHNLVYWMYLMEKPTGRHAGRQRHYGRITQTHLLKLNGRVPGTSLGLRFHRDLLYTAARLPKKGMGIQITQVFIPDDGPCHLLDIPYDAFSITTCQCQYVTYWHGNAGGNCVTEKMVAM